MTHIRRWIRSDDSLVRIHYRESFSLRPVWTRVREKRGKGGERERESRPLVSIGSWLFLSPLSLSFPSIRGVADRLTTIHFAARTYARIAITRRKWILARSFRSIPFDAIDLSHHQPPTASLNKPSFFSYPFVRPIINYRSSPSTSSYSEFRSIRGMKRISM